MLKSIFSIPYTLYKKAGSLIDHMYNTIALQHKKVSYASFPAITGKIRLHGNGNYIFGEHLKFNCSVTSNYVGLYKTCTIAVAKNARLIIGDHSGFSGISIFCTSQIKIGKYVNCGGNVSIWDTDFHPLDFEARRNNDITRIAASPIEIGDDVFIGANSIILKGVSIGDRAIIGAGSVVTKNIPPDEVWAGNPAKFIRKTIPANIGC